MSLVFAGITPHPLLLIENIGKERSAKLTKTKRALLRLEQDLYLCKPTAVCIISPHDSFFENAFSINTHHEMRSSFDEFGDLTTSFTWKGAPHLAAVIAHQAQQEKLPVQLVSKERVGHGSAVPLSFLTNHLPKIKILPIGYSALEPKDHLRFGEMLKDIFMDSRERIAVIASGDLSQCLTDLSPAGYHEAGKQFDDQLIELLETKNTIGISQMPPELVRNAEQCGYRSILIQLGILKNMEYKFKNYCYEAPFGVGYLTGNFVFS